MVKKFVDEDPAVVTKDQTRYVMVARAKSGRWAIVVRRSTEHRWQQVASRPEWPISRDEAIEYETSQKAREAALELVDGLTLRDWGEDGFLNPVATPVPHKEVKAAMQEPVKANPFAGTEGHLIKVSTPNGEIWAVEYWPAPAVRTDLIEKYW